VKFPLRNPIFSTITGIQNPQAIAFFKSQDCVEYCEWLDLDPGRVQAFAKAAAADRIL
jgi:hypothetical protein